MTIKHSSGLVVEFDDVLGWQTEDASLAIFQASEKARAAIAKATGEQA